MKLTSLLVFVTVLNAFASKSYSQFAKITLNMENASIKEVLNAIEEQSEFFFLYSSKMIDVTKEVDVYANNKLITDILDEILPSADIKFTIKNRQILLVDSKSEIISDNQQQIIVSGSVTDSQTGQLMPGVNIQVKGTTIGNITDAVGKFSLSPPSPNAIFVFTFIGYKGKEIPVDGRSIINVTLDPDLLGLEEVVVIGFGTQKKVNLTGAVANINAKTLEARPVTTVAQSLQGLVTGLNITQKAGGNLSNEADLNIRGITTIGTGSTGNPLILIDGMEGDLNALNPQDIESISVLKDAASSSIYGSRAPFGVILITTKKGKAGRATISYNNSFRWNIPLLIPDQADSYTFALYFNDGGYNKGQGAIFNDVQLKRIKDYQDGVITASNIPNPSNPQFWAYDMEPNDNVDWYDVMYKDIAPSMEHAFNISGGTDNINYFFSGSYLYQRGLMELSYDDYNRYNLTGKISAKLSDWSSVDYSIRWGRYEVDEPSWLNKAFSFNANQGRRSWPTWPLYDPNGYMYQLGRYDFPVGIAQGGRAREQRDVVYQQIKLTIEPIKDWKIFGEFNYRVNDNFDDWHTLILYNHDVNGIPVVSVPTSRVYEEAGRSNFLNPNLYSEYLKTLNEHSVKLMVGFQSEISNDRSFSVRRDGIIIPDLTDLNVTTGTDIDGNPLTPQISGAKNHWATIGYFGRLNYDYGGRYLMEFNLRYDGTSRFRSDKRWNFFPSFSLGWNVAKESFWDNFEEYVSTLKLRGSYGVLGNQNTTNLYPTYVSLPIGVANGSWLVNGRQPNTASLPSLISSTLSWEKVRSYNLGVDLAALKTRFTATFDYFVRYTNDMVGPAPELPVILGRTVPRTNNTDLKTFGFELDLSWQDRVNNKLGYNIHLLLFDSQTKILKYPNPTGILTTYRDGMMAGEIWGFTTIGIAQTDEEMASHLSSLTNGGQDAIGSSWKAGDIMYRDINGDGKIDQGKNTIEDHGDLTIIGNNTPRYSYGLDLGADWKGLDLRVFFQGVFKKEFFQNSAYFWGIQGSMWSSMSFVEHIDYFRNDPNHLLGQNLDSYFPRPIFDVTKNQRVQSRYLQNSAYLRLKNTQIGYTLPQRITSKIGIDRLRVYVSGENLWTKTKLITIFDPETIDGGSGGNVYPLSKVYSFGLMITL